MTYGHVLKRVDACAGLLAGATLVLPAGAASAVGTRYEAETAPDL